MACACKANQQINYLQRKYGVDNKGDNAKSNIRGNFGSILSDIAVKLIVIILSPIIFIHVLFSKKKGVNITKVLGLSK